MVRLKRDLPFPYINYFGLLGGGFWLQRQRTQRFDIFWLLRDLSLLWLVPMLLLFVPSLSLWVVGVSCHWNWFKDTSIKVFKGSWGLY